MENNNVTFLTVSEFKANQDFAVGKILKNPKTGKLFLAGDNGKNYKVQASIDTSKEMKILVDNGDYDNACLVNVKPGAEEIASI